MFIIGFITLIYGKKNYVLKKPAGSPVFDAIRIVWIRVRTGGFEAAKSGGGRGKANRPWNDRFVEELRETLRACRVFVSCLPSSLHLMLFKGVFVWILE
jgi:POT family proton-dependent oligopeptide transporter